VRGGSGGQLLTEYRSHPPSTVRTGYDEVRHTERVTLADTLRAATSGPDGTHLYLSTSCVHGVHEHCRSAVNVDGGPKAPGTCKHCPARCVCPCHPDAP
jgi:hypothetical protein